MRLARIVTLAAVVATIIATGAFGFAIVDYPPPPNGAVGKPYNYVFKPYEGAPPYAFYFKAGTLPPGLKIEPDGTTHGTPTQPGTFDFTVEATQYCAPDPSCATQKGFTVQVRDALNITTTALKSATIGTPYTAPLSVTGNGGLGMGWSVTAGSLPPGLTLAANGSPGDTTISGTPTAIGSSTFTVKVGDTDGFLPDRSTTKQVTLAVVAPLTVAAPKTTPTAFVGRQYTGASPTVAGGLGPYAWTLKAGAIPAGLSVDPESGALIGKPTAAGTFDYTVGVVDVDGRTATVSLGVTVAAELDLATTRVRAAKVDRPYRTKLVAKGGLGTLKWKVTGGSLPAGLRLGRLTGILSGTPKTPGVSRFRVTVNDAVGQRSSARFKLTVRA
jgi:Putative Ig domain